MYHYTLSKLSHNLFKLSCYKVQLGKKHYSTLPPTESKSRLIRKKQKTKKKTNKTKQNKRKQNKEKKLSLCQSVCRPWGSLSPLNLASIYFLRIEFIGENDTNRLAFYYQANPYHIKIHTKEEEDGWPFKFWTCERFSLY